MKIGYAVCSCSDGKHRTVNAYSNDGVISINVDASYSVIGIEKSFIPNTQTSIEISNAKTQANDYCKNINK